MHGQGEGKGDVIPVLNPYELADVPE